MMASKRSSPPIGLYGQEKEKDRNELCLVIVRVDGGSGRLAVSGH